MSAFTVKFSTIDVTENYYIRCVIIKSFNITFEEYLRLH